MAGSHQGVEFQLDEFEKEGALPARAPLFSGWRAGKLSNHHLRFTRSANQEVC